MMGLAQRRLAGAVALAILVLLLQMVLGAPPAGAADTVFTADFAAAAPLSYDHDTGGGAWDDKSIGTEKDVVESLEGGDFECGDVVTYLQQIVVDAGATGAQTIQLGYEFLAKSTGQPGAAHSAIELVQVNYGTVQDLIDGTHVDSGIADDGGSSIQSMSWGYSPSGTSPFDGAHTVDLTYQLTDLEPGEAVVMRIDVRLSCNGETPTGNLQASLVSKTTVVGDGTFSGGGNQTVPFKQLGGLVTTSTTTTSSTTTTTSTTTSSTTTPSTTTTSTTLVPTTTTQAPTTTIGIVVLGTTITTSIPEVVAETLPFTGFEPDDAVSLAVLALLAGALLLIAVFEPRTGRHRSALTGWRNRRVLIR